MSDFHVAIVGAGPSGLALALALHAQSIPCTIYEARDVPLNNIGGGVVLAPNGLKALQGMGVYDSLLDHSYAFDVAYVQHGPSGAILDTTELGSEAKYGTKALRVYRYTLLEQLLAKVHAASIPVHFHHRLSHILAETEHEVSWQFTDGSSASASILVGADGIHSAVRKHIAPGIEPAYDGIVTVYAHVPTAQLELPALDLKDLKASTNQHPLPSFIVVPGSGGMLCMPETKSGNEIMISVMRSVPDELNHWGSLSADKERLRAMICENADQFPQVVRNAVRHIASDKLHIWPGYQIPLLQSWTSGRVVIVGDALHALPPHAGQGISQGLEDVYLFAGILGSLGGAFTPARLQAAFRAWQQFRQERIDGVVRLTKIMELRRLPAAAQEKERIAMNAESLKASLNEEYAKLFSIDYPAAVRECLERAQLTETVKDEPGEPFTSSSL